MIRAFVRPAIVVFAAAMASAPYVACDARTAPNPEGRLVLDPFSVEAAIDAGGTTAPPPAPRGGPVPLPPGASLIATTYYDLEDMGSLGTRIVRRSNGELHATYMDDFCELDGSGCPPDLGAPNPHPQRGMGYAYRPAAGAWSVVGKVGDPGIHGCCVTEVFGGYGAMALTTDGRAAVVQHMNEDGCDLRGCLYIQDSAGVGTYSAYLTPITDPSYLFPQVVATPSGAFVMLGEHPEVGSYSEVEEFRVSRLAFEGQPFLCPVGWQFGNWTTKISDASFPDGQSGFPCIAAATNGKVGVAMTDFGGQVRLVESSDGTFAPGTLTTTQLTSYNDANVVAGDFTSQEYRPYIHCHLAYRGTTPHVVWSELQARRDGSGVFYADYRSRVMHWTPGEGTSVVHRTAAGVADSYDDIDSGGSGPIAGFNTITVDWPQVGFSDDGTLRIVVFTRFVDAEIDPTADAGLPGIVTGIGYGDVAACVSRGGGVWSPAENLTNSPQGDDRFPAIPTRSANGKTHLLWQTSAFANEAGVTMIGDRGFGSINYERRIAYLEPTLGGGAVDAPEVAGFAGDGFEWDVRPNPVRGDVRFVLARPNDGSVRGIEVFDVTGRSVVRVPAALGETSVAWDGEVDGRRLPGGVYFARLVRGAGAPAASVRRLVLVR